MIRNLKVLKINQQMCGRFDFVLKKVESPITKKILGFFKGVFFNNKM